MKLNNNNLMSEIMKLYQRYGQNTQLLLKENPQFAQFMQGKNAQQLYSESIQQMGLNPNQIMQMFKR